MFLSMAKGNFLRMGLASWGEAFKNKFLWLVPGGEVRYKLLLAWKKKQLCCEPQIRPHSQKQLKEVLSQQVAWKWGPQSYNHKETSSTNSELGRRPWATDGDHRAPNIFTVSEKPQADNLQTPSLAFLLTETEIINLHSVTQFVILCSRRKLMLTVS